LFLDVPFHCFPIGPFADGCYVVAVRPELAAPEVFLDRRFSGEYLACGDTLEYLDDATRGEFWMGSAEEVILFLSIPIVSVSISYLSWIPIAVSLIIPTTSSSRRDFRYLTGKTMW
jgi:hypothetical protein